MPEFRPTSHRFHMAFRTELHMLVVNWGYPLLHVLWAMLLFFLFVKQPDQRSSQALLETTVGRISIGLISLVGIFLTGISNSRSQQSKFIELEETFPTGFELIMGRWLAGLLSLLLFLIEPVGIAAIQGPLSSLVRSIPIFVGEAALTIAFTTASVWALIIWLKPGRWVYSFMVAGWLGFLLSSTLLTNIYPPARLLNFMRQGTSFYTELWGRLIYGAQPYWFNLFYAGLLLSTLALQALGLHLKRYKRPFLWTGAMLIIGLILAGFGGSRYVSGVQAVQNASLPLSGNPVLSAQPTFSVDAYDLTMDLNDPAVPQFSVQLTAHNNSTQTLDVLTFTLNPVMVIRDTNLPVTQEDQLVFVHLLQPLASGDTLALTFQYEGALRMETISEGVVEASDFIDPKGVRLTPGSNWYPVPAGLSETPGLHGLAHIQLRVIGSDLHFGANLPPTGENIFEADGAGWIFLVGSAQLVMEQIGSTILITSQNDLSRARPLADVFAGPLQSIAPFFPDVPVHGLVLMVLGEENGLPDYTPPVTGYPLIVTTSYQFSPSPKNQDAQLGTVVRTLSADLWQLSGGTLDPRVGEVTGLDQAFTEIAHFLRTYVKDGNDPDKMQANYEVEMSRVGSAGDPAYMALLDGFRNYGKEGIIQVVRQMLLEEDDLRQMPYDALPAWISATTGSGQ
jgi:hypothetical protein